MKRVMELMSDNRPKNEFYLAQNKKKEDPASIKASDTGEAQFRIPMVELELAYLKHPLTFNSINRNTQTIVSTNEILIHENPEVVKYFRNFLDNIGTQGSQTSWSQLKEMIFRFPMIYGKQFTELIYDASGTEILDLDSIDPKQMDYATDSNSSVVLNDYGNPVGYVQTVPFSHVGGIKSKFETPPGVVLNGNQIYIPASHIAQFKFWVVGPGFYPIGLIEPSYLSIKTVLQLNKDYAERAHTILFPMRVATVGDENHEPSPEKIRNITEGLKSATAATEVGLPYHIKLNILESQNPDSMKNFLGYFNEDIIQSSGIPAPYATGQAVNANKATLEKLNQMYELGLKDFVERTCRAIENQIFRPIAKINGIPGYPKIRIGPIGVDERNEKHNRLLGYIAAGIIDPTNPKVLAYISAIEDIDIV